jgi:hypothetical protein
MPVSGGSTAVGDIATGSEGRSQEQPAAVTNRIETAIAAAC